MKGGRQRRRADRRHAARSEEQKAIVEPEALGGSGPAEKIQKIGAAAEQDVLAIVNRFRAARRQERRSPASEHRPLFEHFDIAAGLCQPNRRRQSRQAASQNDYARNRCHPASSPAFWRSCRVAAWSTTSIFSRRVSAAAWEKTLPPLLSMRLRIPR